MSLRKLRGLLIFSRRHCLTVFVVDVIYHVVNRVGSQNTTADWTSTKYFFLFTAKLHFFSIIDLYVVESCSTPDRLLFEIGKLGIRDFSLLGKTRKVGALCSLRFPFLIFPRFPFPILLTPVLPVCMLPCDKLQLSI